MADVPTLLPLPPAPSPPAPNRRRRVPRPRPALPSRPSPRRHRCLGRLPKRRRPRHRWRPTGEAPCRARHQPWTSLRPTSPRPVCLDPARAGKPGPCESPRLAGGDARDAAARQRRRSDRRLTAGRDDTERRPPLRRTSTRWMPLLLLAPLPTTTLPLVETPATLLSTKSPRLTPRLVSLVVKFVDVLRRSRSPGHWGRCRRPCCHRR